MPLPCPGPAQISLVDIQNEFGGSNPIGLNEYYRNGGLVPSNNTSVPTSGSISLGNFFCAVNEIIVYITSNSENVNVQSLFGDNWIQNAPKRLVINSGVVIGATNTSNYALNIPSGLVSTLRIDNNGSIQGAGGGGNSGNGGPAILANTAVTINNIGSIYGGGGGGGKGGTGGSGYYIYQEILGGGQDIAAGCDASCPPIHGEGSYCEAFQCLDGGSSEPSFCWDCRRDVYVGTSGGEGGNGGQGQGYAQNSTGGSSGSPGGTNAGSGGDGGAGGGFGNDGGGGNTGGNGNIESGYGGSGGGLAGCYITNNGNVSWINTGDRRGRVC